MPYECRVRHLSLIHLKTEIDDTVDYFIYIRQGHRQVKTGSVFQLAFS